EERPAEIVEHGDDLVASQVGVVVGARPLRPGAAGPGVRAAAVVALRGRSDPEPRPVTHRTRNGTDCSQQCAQRNPGQAPHSFPRMSVDPASGRIRSVTGPRVHDGSANDVLTNDEVPRSAPHRGGPGAVTPSAGPPARTPN